MLSGLWLCACLSEAEPGDGDCPSVLPEAPLGCDDPSCSATSGTRRIAEARLSESTATSWFVLTSNGTVENGFGAGNPTIDLGLESEGGLSPRPPTVDRAELRRRVEARRTGWSPERLRRAEAVAVEAPVREAGRRLGPTGLRSVGSRLRPRAQAGGDRQTASCTDVVPDCGPDAVCIIPSGSEGSCETDVDLTLLDQTIQTEVRLVSERAAFLVGVDDVVSSSDLQTLADRFDDHIAPVVEAFFGRPVRPDGRDFDGNGRVLIVLSESVGDVLGDSVVGLFIPEDLTPEGNGADVLFMQPPSSRVSLDQLSGTIGHEYQHLINFFTRSVLQSSSAEEVWLDEGLSTFVEDALGYGRDAFDNVSAFLDSVSLVSLTGPAVVPLSPVTAGNDSIERRGMAHLLVRYVFEQAGGAEFDSPGVVADAGGLSAVRRLVQSPETGRELFTAAASGRSFAQWVEDLLLTVALDGTSIPDVSCNPRFRLRPPETDSFTGFQRGIDLRTAVPGLSSRFDGPAVDPFVPVVADPLPADGGAIRQLVLTNAESRVVLSTDADNLLDLDFGLRAVPAP
jgi:hypothetical protein